MFSEDVDAFKFISPASVSKYTHKSTGKIFISQRDGYSDSLSLRLKSNDGELVAEASVEHRYDDFLGHHRPIYPEGAYCLINLRVYQPYQRHRLGTLLVFLCACEVQINSRCHSFYVNYPVPQALVFYEKLGFKPDLAGFLRSTPDSSIWGYERNIYDKDFGVYGISLAYGQELDVRNQCKLWRADLHILKTSLSSIVSDTFSF